MDCHEEVAILERRLKGLPGLEALSADILGQRLNITYDAAKLSASAIAEAVAQTGMRAWLEHEEPVGPAASAATRRLFVVTAGVLFGAGMALEYAGLDHRAVVATYLLAIVSGGVYSVRRALHAARSLALDINVLMLVAVCGAMVLGQWSEGAAVVFLFAGDIVVVKPGEKIPLDGRVVAGESYVNQAPVTGESLPAEKRIGDEVFAGTINGRGALDVGVTRLRGDSTLARIIDMVERAQAQRAPSQTFVERFARVYTPAVLILAVTIGILPPALLGASWSDWIYRALVLLVISCPCALVISTPVSVVSALAAAARKGVLIKGGAHLERLANVRCVAFDKTGTLTKGDLRVAHVASLKALVDGTHVAIGNHRLFEERGACSPDVHARIEAVAAAAGGQTLVIVGADQPIGIIGVSDRPRQSARDAVRLLREHGVAHVALLTGDHPSAGRALGEAVGVDEVRAGLLPADKVQAVEELRRTYGTVAMVGDGINDAPALAAADVGIAMGVAGSDAALETADVALMADELLKIPYALRLSRATVRNVRANIAFSIALKGAFLVMAVMGVATLWMAVVADMGASLIVIANALRLLRE